MPACRTTWSTSSIPRERYSAGEFARRAREAIAGIQGRGRVPILVGGSGLYLRALIQGISPIPPGDPEVRGRLRERLDAEGLAPLAAELARAGPGDRGAARRRGYPASAEGAGGGAGERPAALRLDR